MPMANCVNPERKMNLKNIYTRIPPSSLSQNGPQISSNSDSILTRARDIDLKSFIRRNEKSAGTGCSTIRSNSRIPLSQNISSSYRSYAESDSLALVFDALKACVDAEELGNTEKNIAFAEIVERVGHFVAEKDIDDSDAIFNNALKVVKRHYNLEKRKMSLGLPSELDDYFSAASLEKDLKGKKKRAPKPRCFINKRGFEHIEEFKQAMTQREMEPGATSVGRPSDESAITTVSIPEAKKVYPAWERGENGFPVFSLPYNPSWVGEKAQLLKTAYYSQHYRVTGNEIQRTPVNVSRIDSAERQLLKSPVLITQDTVISSEKKIEDVAPSKKIRVEKESEPQTKSILKVFKDKESKNIAQVRTEILRNLQVEEAPYDGDHNDVEIEKGGKNALQEFKRRKVDEFPHNLSPIQEHENISLRSDCSPLPSVLENLSEISSIVESSYGMMGKKQLSSRPMQFQESLSSDDGVLSICSPVNEEERFADNISIISPVVPLKADQQKVFEYKEISMQRGAKENPRQKGQAYHQYVESREITFEGNYTNMFGPIKARHTRTQFFHMT